MNAHQNVTVAGQRASVAIIHLQSHKLPLKPKKGQDSRTGQQEGTCRGRPVGLADLHSASALVLCHAIARLYELRALQEGSGKGQRKKGGGGGGFVGGKGYHLSSFGPMLDNEHQLHQARIDGCIISE